MRLVSWSDVRAYVFATYPATREPRDGALTVTVDLPEGRPDIEIAMHDVDGSAWLAVSGRVGPNRNAVITWSLTSNWRSPVGNLGFLDGDLATRQLIPLDTEVVNLEETVKAIAYQCILGKKRLED
jgi:hypothetical protein